MAYSVEKDIEKLGKRHVKARAKLKPKKKSEDWVSRLKRNVKMLLKGKNYKSPAMKKKERGY